MTKHFLKALFFVILLISFASSRSWTPQELIEITSENDTLVYPEFSLDFISSKEVLVELKQSIEDIKQLDINVKCFIIRSISTQYSYSYYGGKKGEKNMEKFVDDLSFFII